MYLLCQWETQNTECKTWRLCHVSAGQCQLLRAHTRVCVWIVLNEHDKQDHLKWHDGAILDDEIWVKIGGDHGGGSFKHMLQIANLKNTNSKFNTCLITIAE